MQAKKSSKKHRQVRRVFTPEFKADVVRLCRDGGEEANVVSNRLGLTESAVRNWVKQAEVDAVGGTSDTMTTADREELQQLRRECKRLQMERDVLKRAVTFFAKDNS